MVTCVRLICAWLGRRMQRRLTRGGAGRLGVFWAACLAGSVQAAMPDYQVESAQGERLLLWVSSERGRAEPEAVAARRLAQQGVAVWLLDVPSAYFLPQLPSSMDRVSVDDMADWLRQALGGGKAVTVYAVARAAVPILRAVSRLEPAERRRLCLLLMYPNLYQSADALADANYLQTGRIEGLSIRLLQPRRSAATPWLSAQVAHLANLGARVTPVLLENLREGFWARESPTPYETLRSQQLDTLVLQELEACR